MDSDAGIKLAGFHQNNLWRCAALLPPVYWWFFVLLFNQMYLLGCDFCADNFFSIEYKFPGY